MNVTEADWFRWLPSLLVVVGWGIVIFNANRTSRRAEVRALCNSCIEKLEKIDEFVLSKAFEEGCRYDIESVIISRITLVEIKGRQLLKKTGYTFWNESRINEIRSNANNQAEQYTIHESLLDTIEEIETSFDQVYPRRNILRHVEVRTFLLTTLILGLYLFFANQMLSC